MLYIKTPMRNDQAGQGHFKASRGSRPHNGIDFEAPVNSIVLSPASGKITKHGYPYGDDLSYRYIEVTDMKGLRHRLFYCELLPKVKVGDNVRKDSFIGFVQDITSRYPESHMKNHIHFEVMNQDDDYLNPEDIYGALGGVNDR